MKGIYEVKVWNNRVRYNLVLQRNVTVIQGDSGTGKTTLYNMVIAMNGSRGSGVKSNCADKLVAAGFLTKRTANKYKDRIIVADETCDCLYHDWFIDAINEGKNYFLIITRNNLPKVAYSIREIYGLVSRRDGDLYVTELFRVYTSTKKNMRDIRLIITEDSNAGNELIQKSVDCAVVSAGGNGNVYNLIEKNIKIGSELRVVVDGAAFGAFIGKVSKICTKYNISLFAPESFEFLLLKHVMFRRFLHDELENTYDYCDSRNFLSWERYYTWLLDYICYNKFSPNFHYSKRRLPEMFKTDSFKVYIRNIVLGIN